jgi:signal transduction histidine kinase/ligand-binding sensor domain-containing protein/AraC-like DNA-binding protein
MATKANIVHWFIVFSFLSIYKLSFPQYDEVKFEHITVEDGLPENSISCILQDHLGFLWLGTQNGLVKYDGYTMTVYRTDPNDTNSISGNGIQAICEDHNGNIWIGILGTLWDMGSGLNRFDRNTETFMHFVHNPADTSSINSNSIITIYEDESLRMWIGTDKGLNLFDERNNNFYQYYFQDSSKLKEGRILAIGENQLTGDVLVGSEFLGLWKCDLEKNVLTRINFVDKAKFLNTCAILGFQKSDNEFLWMGTNKGLAQLNLISNQLKFYQIVPSTKYIQGNANDFTSILQDKNGLIWTGTTGEPGEGLCQFDPETEQFKRFKYESFNPHSLRYNSILSLCEDKSGILWVGTHMGGLSRWDRKKWKFKHFGHDPKTPNSISEDNVVSICEDEKGILWLGTFDRGLNRYDRIKNQFTCYLHDPLNPYSISNNGLESVIDDPVESGVLWIGTWGAGLDKFYKEEEIFIHFQHDPTDDNSISCNIIRTLFIDSRGVLWIGTEEGLNRFNRKTKKFKRFQNDPEDSTSLSGDRVNSIIEDNAGTIWIGTDGYGINRFNPVSENFVSYKSLSNNEWPKLITCLYEDKKGNLWIGTHMEGIYLFDRKKGIYTKNLNEKDGLSNNVVRAILEDDSGNLWISTTTGLSKFNPTTESFKNFGRSEGLGGIRFNFSAIKTKSGEMIFVGEHGFNIFHPDSVKDDPVPPQVVIANVSLFNRPGEKLIFEQFISELDEIILTYNQNDLSFDFVGLHYGDPRKNSYKYILDGFDDDWIDAGTQRNATYTNLDPGEYIFRCNASNRDGIWHEKGASIKIIILPPWWATTWAYFFYAILIISIVYFTWKLQLKRVRIKHDYEMSRFEAEKMHEVDKLKSRFFANISHEFRTPLTLILGLARKIGDKTKETSSREDAGVIKRNAGRLNGLVNQLLDLSKLESGNMTLRTYLQSIIPLLKGLVLSFASYAERKRITLKFNSDEKEIVAYIDKDKIEKIVTNLLSNAFKFTPEGGSINVNVKTSHQITSPLTMEGTQGGFVEIQVNDTGIGIAENRIEKIFDRFYQVDGSHTREQEGTGLGLALTKELVELHKGKIRVESSEGKGSTFTVALPLGKDHLKSEEIIESKVETEEVVPYEVKLSPENEEQKVGAKIEAVTEEEKLLLLIVEDNADVRNYVKGNLEEEFRTLEAVDGEDGLNQSISQIPDLIISDVMMPKMDGFEMCNKLKNDERTSHIPVIMLTAKATDKDKIDGYKTGADDYIMKPFDTEVLRARIINLIQQRDRLREHFKKEGIIQIDETNVTPTDKIFLKKALDIINKHISDETFSVDVFADEIAMSRSQLGRKLVALVGESPGDLIRRIRLTKAAKLIEEDFGNISEIAAEVGFNNPSNFARSFRTQFGVPPSDYLGSKK